MSATKPTVIDAIRGEYLRYKALAEAAIAQLDDDALAMGGPGHNNSVATICWHISGNLQSRFTDFLTSDGEKPWRVREEEFLPRAVTKTDLLAKWEQGWAPLVGALAALSDGDLNRTVVIRGQPLSVIEALMRSVTHTSHHVGQIVYIAKGLKGSHWKYLSIPPGQSDVYNRSPVAERPAGHQAALSDRATPT